LAATSAAIAPFAPGLFSTTAETPKILFKPSATVRADWSVAEPGPNGTMILKGPLGKDCARGSGGGAAGEERATVEAVHSPKLPAAQSLRLRAE
jgi:hypothetical protein